MKQQRVMNRFKNLNKLIKAHDLINQNKKKINKFKKIYGLLINIII